MINSEKNIIKKSLWLPIEIWNLNELFTTESISPISFYKERKFGNPINRNQEKFEDANNLILFDNEIRNPILLEVSIKLLDRSCLREITPSKKVKLKSYEYSKTIYLRNGHFNIHFCAKEKLEEFLINAFMLLEVKTTNKYKNELRVLDVMTENNAIYQTTFISNKLKYEPFFDKAFNQIKGLIYGYLIGCISNLGEREQNLLTNLSKLKNMIGSVHTDIVISEDYNGFWLINIRNHMNNCQKNYFENFGKQSDKLDTLMLRLIEIDNLNKMRCLELSNQKKTEYQRDYEVTQRSFEKNKQQLHMYEVENEIINIREELEQLKQEEKYKGVLKGKKREFYKLGTEEYNRKQELKKRLSIIEESEDYRSIKRQLYFHEEKLRNFQFGMTKFDTSISEQFSRITEYLYEIIKNTTNYFQSINNTSNQFPDILFDIGISELTKYYYLKKTEYQDFSVTFPNSILSEFENSELQLLRVAVNAVLSNPQGRLGDFSEEKVLEIIRVIENNSADNSFKQSLRDYYNYRIGKSDNFNFPENSIMANVIVFLMKLNGYDQINKMVIARNIDNRQIALLLYGAFWGFANMPKTFTNIIFDSENSDLFNYIDNYLFNRYVSVENL